MGILALWLVCSAPDVQSQFRISGGGRCPYQMQMNVWMTIQQPQQCNCGNRQTAMLQQPAQPRLPTTQVLPQPQLHMNFPQRVPQQVHINTVQRMTPQTHIATTQRLTPQIHINTAQRMTTQTHVRTQSMVIPKPTMLVHTTLQQRPGPGLARLNTELHLTTVKDQAPQIHRVTSVDRTHLLERTTQIQHIPTLQRVTQIHRVPTIQRVTNVQRTDHQPAFVQRQPTLTRPVDRPQTLVQRPQPAPKPTQPTMVNNQPQVKMGIQVSGSCVGCHACRRTPTAIGLPAQNPQFLVQQPRLTPPTLVRNPMVPVLPLTALQPPRLDRPLIALNVPRPNVPLLVPVSEPPLPIFVAQNPILPPFLMQSPAPTSIGTLTRQPRETFSTDPIEVPEQVFPSKAFSPGERTPSSREPRDETIVAPPPMPVLTKELQAERVPETVARLEPLKKSRPVSVSPDVVFDPPALPPVWNGSPFLFVREIEESNTPAWTPETVDRPPALPPLPERLSVSR
jgi:hypothetical protein